MDRSNRVAQMYGYTVCLVSIILALFTAPQIVGNVFAYTDPLAAPRTDFSDGAVASSSLTSFEAYRATQPRRVGRPAMSRAAAGQAEPAGVDAAAADSTTDADLRARYEALRFDRITRVRFQAAQSLTTHVILLVVVGLLFLTHWRWLRRLPRADDGAASA
jgi:hypothetical protein